MKTEDCFYQFVVLVFKCGGRSFGKQPENGCLFLRLFSDLAALVWPRSDCLTDWLLTLKPHSSCWSESWFNQTKDAFFSPSREEEGVGLTNSFWTRIFIGDFWESCLVSLQRKLFPETGTKTMKYQKIQTDVLSVALLLGFLFFSFLQQRCQRRAQPKQTDNRECTTSINTGAWGRRSSFTSLNEHNKMTRSMYCKKKRKEKKNKGQKKQIIFIFLLISCFRHFCFELLII